MPAFSPISHEDFLAMLRDIAARLADEATWRPDFLIGIGRGGLVPAVYLSHASGLPMLSIDYSAQVPDFADELLVTLAVRTRGGERLLLVDDINDTGRTIAALRSALASTGAEPAHVRFATLIDNVHSAERVDYAARTIDRAIDKAWYVFPWEAIASAAAIAEDAAAVPERTA